MRFILDHSMICILLALLTFHAYNFIMHYFVGRQINMNAVSRYVELLRIRSIK